MKRVIQNGTANHQQTRDEAGDTEWHGEPNDRNMERTQPGSLEQEEEPEEEDEQEQTLEESTAALDGPEICTIRA